MPSVRVGASPIRSDGTAVERWTFQRSSADCGGNGLLVDFFSPEQIADRVIEALEDVQSFASMRRNARQTIIDRYDLHSICLPAHLRMLNMPVPADGRTSLKRLRVAMS